MLQKYIKLLCQNFMDAGSGLRRQVIFNSSIGINFSGF